MSRRAEQSKEQPEAVPPSRFRPASWWSCPGRKSSPGLHDVAEFGEGGHGQVADQRGRCAARPRSPAAAMDNSTYWVETSSPAHYGDHVRRRPPLLQGLLPRAVPGAGTPPGNAVTDSVKVPATPRRTATTPSRTSAARRPSSATRQTPGTTLSVAASSPGQDQGLPRDARHVGPLRLRRRRRLQRARRLHRPLPGHHAGGARRPARATTPSGRTTGTSTPRRHGHRPDRQPASAVARSEHRSGSATAPSTPRTSASACSRTVRPRPRPARVLRQRRPRNGAGF